MECIKCRYYQEYYEDTVFIENECKLTGDCYFMTKDNCNLGALYDDLNKYEES